MRSLKGEFSKKINDCLEELVEIRMHVEAKIDFSEDDISTHDESIIFKKIDNVHLKVRDIQSTAKQGYKLREGLSIVLVGGGLIQLKRHGGYKHREDQPGNLAFENTERVVTEGIYKFIRHPMYGSLLLLAWGALVKNLGPLKIAIAVLVTIFLFLTARMEERENISFFGESYREYMKGTRMFIPYIF